MGHLVEVRLPEEIPSLGADKMVAADEAPVPEVANLEEADFLESRELREAIHAREGGLCFYCLRRLTPTMRCLDHVVPRVQMGGNSYRNLVSSCVDCNAKKGVRPADEFFRQLYREGTLSPLDLAGRLRALDDLTSGKLRPQLPKPFSDRCM